jgi:hypothetical protein
MNFNTKAVCAFTGYIFVVVLLQACMRIPVEVHSPHAEDGTPEPIAVRAEPMHLVQLNGDGSATGVTYRIEAAPDAMDIPPPSPGVPWDAIFQAILGIAGVAGGGWAVVAARTAGKLRKVVQVVSELHDANEAEGAPEDRAINKKAAQERLRRLGMEAEVQRIRGKPIKGE